jgi:hypothetical protein
MGRDKSTVNRIAETLLLGALSVPVVGLLMGGVYSIPALYLTKGRDPWHTLLLAVGLAITVVGGGYLLATPFVLSVGAWGLTLGLSLAARRYHGSLDGNLERFGQVHAAALIIAFGLALARHRGLAENG